MANSIKQSVPNSVVETQEEYRKGLSDGYYSGLLHARVALRRELESFGLSVSEISRMGEVL